MAKTRRNNRSRKVRKNKRGGGFLTDQQYFNPDVLPPSSMMPPLSTAPTSNDIRPVLISTAPSSELMAGGARRRTRSGRKTRGGFSPSIMGSFLPNAQAAIVPLALYLVYNQFVPKSNSVSNNLKKALGGKSNRSRRTRRRSRK